jgi:hypothetical protein
MSIKVNYRLYILYRKPFTKCRNKNWDQGSGELQTKGNSQRDLKLGRHCTYIFSTMHTSMNQKDDFPRHANIMEEDAYEISFLAYFLYFEKIEWAYEITLMSVCVSAYPPIVARQRLCKSRPIIARQRLGRNVTAVMNTHATIEEFLDVSFSVWSMSYQGKKGISSSKHFLF